ncbi:MAG: metallophosphoesterase, partial [Nakamurella sp.]
MTPDPQQSRRGRVALFGDVGGHPKQLRKALVALGADSETLRLPADLTVIQVGDLIHRGPDSPGAMQIAGSVMATQPRQWVQLAGNHEALYLTPPK